MSEPSAEDAVRLLKAALVREALADPATLFPNPADLQAAINFNHRLTGHIIKLTAELQAATVCVCRFHFLFAQFSCLVVVHHRNASVAPVPAPAPSPAPPPVIPLHGKSKAKKTGEPKSKIHPEHRDDLSVDQVVRLFPFPFFPFPLLFAKQ